MSVFLTGSTGYLGSYIAAGLLRDHPDRLALLVRAKTHEEAQERLWKSLQLHMSFEEFSSYLTTRIDIFRGDLTDPSLGLDSTAYAKLVKVTDSIIHCAASLNRKSEKSCLNVNLRGTLEVVKLARAAQDQHGLRRFSDISTVAVAGKRNHEIVTEDKSIEWDRSDYDPYARTKKFCEHMVHELLPEVPITVFRPSIILGDSRFPETTQFDMVRAFVILAHFPIVPFSRKWKLDIVSADFVAKSVVAIHQKAKPTHGIYHLSSGVDAPTFGEITDGLEKSGFRVKHFYTPWLNGLFSFKVNFWAATPRSWGISPVMSLIKVFLPYLNFDTVFDNSRVCAEMEEKPVSFLKYSYPLFRFAKGGKFKYPYKPWPEAGKAMKVAS